LTAEEDAKAAGKQAEAEKAVAEAVNAFLRNDFLAQTGVENQVIRGFQPDADIKMRTLLDRASATVGEAFKDKPRVEAAVRQAIAWPYHQLSNAAKGQLRKDLLAAAEMHQMRALELLQKLLSADHPDSLQAEYRMGAIYMNSNQPAKAEPYFRRVLDGWRRTRGTADPKTLDAMNNLAVAYSRLERKPEADRLYREALDACQRIPGVEDKALQYMMNLGSSYLQQKRYAEAEPLLRQPLEGKRRLLGDKNATTQSAMRILAILYTEQGRYAEAEGICREHLAAMRASWGAGHANTTDALARLGRVLLAQRKCAEAEQMLRECLTIREKDYPDAWETWSVRSLLGGALAGQQEYAEAEPLLLTGYEGQKQRADKIPAASKVRLTLALDRLVQLYEVTGKPDEAARWRAERAQYSASPVPPPMK
jgi:non-specific serine/threonine protein kinase/serine/threonine-protein kinase